VHRAAIDVGFVVVFRSSGLANQVLIATAVVFWLMFLLQMALWD
jgi:hypothetical protein